MPRRRVHAVERVDVLPSFAFAALADRDQRDRVFAQVDVAERRLDSSDAFLGVRVGLAEHVHDLLRARDAEVVHVHVGFLDPLEGVVRAVRVQSQSRNEYTS